MSYRLWNQEYCSQPEMAADDLLLRELATKDGYLEEPWEPSGILTIADLYLVAQQDCAR